MSGGAEPTNKERIKRLEEELRELKKEVDIKFKQYFILLKSEKQRIKESQKNEKS